LEELRRDEMVERREDFFVLRVLFVVDFGFVLFTLKRTFLRVDKVRVEVDG